MPAPDRTTTLNASVADGSAAEGPPRLATHAAAIAAAQRFADSIAETVIERDRSGSAPYDEMARFDASGLLAITVPHAESRPALGPSTLAEVIRVIAAGRHGSAVSSIMARER
jgi:alkylation response protein AidB-like acyl-CoA dehydrogenase